MKKRIFALVMLLSILLCGCGDDTPKSDSGAPGRMVRRIEVAIQPENPEYDRVYQTQENMNNLLALLRSMENDTAPDVEPDLYSGQIYYTATVTFANGQQSVYYLLGHTYMRLGDDPWCVITDEQSMAFNTFLREHPSDDTPAPTETATVPAETTAPTE